jgi:uncharacterized protein with FMN-binding domain
VVVVLVGAMVIVTTSGMGAVRRTAVANVDLSAIGDGSYKGAFSKGRFHFDVIVDVKNNRIDAITLADPAKATDVTRAIAAAIIAKQSVTIDAVSGASLTTRAFAKAVEKALSAAEAPSMTPATSGTT